MLKEDCLWGEGRRFPCVKVALCYIVLHCLLFMPLCCVFCVTLFWFGFTPVGCVCVCMCARAGAWVCICAYVSECIWVYACGGQKLISGVFLYNSLPYLLGQGLSLNLILINLARLASQQAPRDPCGSPSPDLGLQMLSMFKWTLGI